MSSECVATWAETDRAQRFNLARTANLPKHQPDSCGKVNTKPAEPCIETDVRIQVSQLSETACSSSTGGSNQLLRFQSHDLESVPARHHASSMQAQQWQPDQLARPTPMSAAAAPKLELEDVDAGEALSIRSSRVHDHLEASDASPWHSATADEAQNAIQARVLQAAIQAAIREAQRLRDWAETHPAPRAARGNSRVSQPEFSSQADDDDSDPASLNTSSHLMGSLSKAARNAQDRRVEPGSFYHEAVVTVGAAVASSWDTTTDADFQPAESLSISGATQRILNHIASNIGSNGSALKSASCGFAQPTSRFAHGDLPQTVTIELTGAPSKHLPDHVADGYGKPSAGETQDETLHAVEHDGCDEKQISQTHLSSSAGAGAASCPGTSNSSESVVPLWRSPSLSKVHAQLLVFRQQRMKKASAAAAATAVTKKDAAV